jgi:hypothetical protein
MRIYMASVAPGTETKKHQRLLEMPHRLVSYYYYAYDHTPMGDGSRKLVEKAKGSPDEAKPR